MTIIIMIGVAFRLVCSMVFYGLSLNSGNLGGSVYINFELMALVEIIAYVGCVLLLNRLGRKLVHIACMMLGGGACLSTIFAVLYASSGQCRRRLRRPRCRLTLPSSSSLLSLLSPSSSVAASPSSYPPVLYHHRRRH